MAHPMIRPDEPLLESLGLTVRTQTGAGVVFITAVARDGERYAAWGFDREEALCALWREVFPTPAARRLAAECTVEAVEPSAVRAAATPVATPAPAAPLAPVAEVAQPPAPAATPSLTHAVVPAAEITAVVDAAPVAEVAIVAAPEVQSTPAVSFVPPPAAPAESSTPAESAAPIAQPMGPALPPGAPPAPVRAVGPFQPPRSRSAPVRTPATRRTTAAAADEGAADVLGAFNTEIDAVAVSHRDVQAAWLTWMFCRAKATGAKAVIDGVFTGSNFLRPGPMPLLRPSAMLPATSEAWRAEADHAARVLGEVRARLDRVHGLTRYGYADGGVRRNEVDAPAAGEVLRRFVDEWRRDGLLNAAGPGEAHGHALDDDARVRLVEHAKVLRCVRPLSLNDGAKRVLYTREHALYRLPWMWGALTGTLRAVASAAAATPDGAEFAAQLNAVLNEETLDWQKIAAKPAPTAAPKSSPRVPSAAAIRAAHEDDHDLADPIDPTLIEKALAFIGGRELVILGNKVNERLRACLAQVLNIDVEWVPVADNPRRLDGVIAGAVDRRCFVMTRHLPHKVTDRVLAADRRAPIVYGVGLKAIVTALADRACTDGRHAA